MPKIICLDCGLRKDHAGHGLCGTCYSRTRYEDPAIREAIRKRSKIRYRENIKLSRKKARASYHRERKKDPKKAWCNNSVVSHKKRGYNIEFTKNDLYNRIENVEYCEDCGRRLDWNKTGRGLGDNTPTMDIRYPLKRITMENIAIVCLQCNLDKGRYNIDQYNARTYDLTIAEKI